MPPADRTEWRNRHGEEILWRLCEGPCATDPARPRSGYGRDYGSLLFHYRDPHERLVEDRLGNRHSSLEAVERKAQIVARKSLAAELNVVLYLPFWAAITPLAREEERTCSDHTSSQ